MKINVVKDKSGKTVSTFEASAKGLSMEPVLDAGAKVEEMEVSANYKENPAELYKG